MDVEMRVDTTGHTTRSFYDGHGHPFCLMELGMARPFRIGATGGPGLLLQAGPITPTRRRDVPSFNVRLEGLGRRRLATSRDSKSDRTCQHSRSYFGPAIKRWTLREVSMYGGRVGLGQSGITLPTL